MLPLSRYFTKKNIILVICIVAFSFICYKILPISIPLITALFTSLILSPLVLLLRRKFSFSQKWSVITVFSLFIAVIFVLAFFIMTKVTCEITQIVQNLPHYINDLNQAWSIIEQKMIVAAKNFPHAITEVISTQVQSYIDTISTKIGNFLTIERVTEWIKAIPSFLVSMVVYLIALFLFLIDLPVIKEKVLGIMTPETTKKVSYMSTRLSNVFFGFFKAQFLVSIIIFIVSLIGLLIIKPEVAIVMSIIIWVIDFIPIIGSIVILAPWSAFHIMTNNMTIGIQLAVLAIILLIIRRTVEPKVMGSHIGLSPLATLIAMYLGLKLFGVLGFLIGPLLLIIVQSAFEAKIFKFSIRI